MNKLTNHQQSESGAKFGDSAAPESSTGEQLAAHTISQQYEKLIALADDAIPAGGDSNIEAVREMLIIAYMMQRPIDTIADAINVHLERAIDNATNALSIELLCDVWQMLNPELQFNNCLVFDPDGVKFWDYPEGAA